MPELARSVTLCGDWHLRQNLAGKPMNIRFSVEITIGDESDSSVVVRQTVRARY